MKGLPKKNRQNKRRRGTHFSVPISTEFLSNLHPFKPEKSRNSEIVIEEPEY